MKSSLLESYKLQRRISALESIINERTVGPNGQPSKAYQIWDYLMNNGPTSVDDLKSALPKDITKYINFFADNDLLHKNGNMISANANYSWDNVGVIPRTAQQELMQDVRNNIDAPSMDDPMNAMNTPEDGEDSATPSRSARAPRARRVRANLFSRKIEEVRAAIDEGQDVNQKNDKYQTPLVYACNAKQDTSDIVKLLLANGANPNDEFYNKPCISMVIRSNNNESLLALVLAGASWYGSDEYRNVINASNEDTFNKILDKDFTGNVKAYLYILSEILLKSWNKFKSDSITNKILSIAFNNASDKRSILQLIDRIGGSRQLQADYYIAVMDACYKNGWVPAIDNFTDSDYNNQPLCKKLFDSLNLLREGKVKLYDPSSLYLSTVIYIGNKYNWEMGDLSNILTQSYMDSHKEDWQYRFIYYFATSGQSSELVNVLKRIKLKRFSGYDFRNIIQLIADRNDSDLARALCKQMRSYLINELLDQYNYFVLDKIVGSKNEYFINYIIGIDTSKEFINLLIEQCEEEIERGNESRASVCIKVLQDNGYSITSDSKSNARNDRKNRLLIRKIVEFINDDRMTSDIRQEINNNPSILDNEDIQKALNDPSNEHSVTARQLKRQYDQWAAAAEKPKYDM